MFLTLIFLLLINFADRHRTTDYILHWGTKRRLKQSDFFFTYNISAVCGIFKSYVDFLCWMQRKSFHPDLPLITNKVSDVPVLIQHWLPRWITVFWRITSSYIRILEGIIGIVLEVEFLLRILVMILTSNRKNRIFVLCYGWNYWLFR